VRQCIERSELKSSMQQLLPAILCLCGLFGLPLHDGALAPPRLSGTTVVDDVDGARA
jgi:hypothetical protein